MTFLCHHTTLPAQIRIDKNTNLLMHHTAAHLPFHTTAHSTHPTHAHHSTAHHSTQHTSYPCTPQHTAHILPTHTTAHSTPQHTTAHSTNPTHAPCNRVFASPRSPSGARAGLAMYLASSSVSEVFTFGPCCCVCALPAVPADTQPTPCASSSLKPKHSTRAHASACVHVCAIAVRARVSMCALLCCGCTELWVLVRGALLVRVLSCVFSPLLSCVLMPVLSCVDGAREGAACVGCVWGLLSLAQ